MRVVSPTLRHLRPRETGILRIEETDDLQAYSVNIARDWIAICSHTHDIMGKRGKGFVSVVSVYLSLKAEQTLENQRWS